jgi:hypothetical protein
MIRASGASLRPARGDEVMIFNSHNPVDYETCRCGGFHAAG